LSKAKPFSISKRVVFEAYKRVRANQGAAGVDEESIADFEKNLKNNLYKIWNRMSSGSYFPPAVRLVEIAKKDGGQKKLGVPTVSDRIAQMVAKMYFEPEVDRYFHPDSYGYRPGKSAIEAVGVARKRCWRYNWVVDLDIKGFFVSFLPAVSDEATKSMRRTIRSWRIHRMTDKSIKDLACMFNPVIRGWINYYGQFYKSALYPMFNQLNGALQRWAMRKYKKLRRRRRRAFYWLGRIAKQMSHLFAHWRLVRQSAGR
jgi:hypothetical protein